MVKLVHAIWRASAGRETCKDQPPSGPRHPCRASRIVCSANDDVHCGSLKQHLDLLRIRDKSRHNRGMHGMQAGKRRLAAG